MAEQELKKVCVNCDNYCVSYSEVEGICRVLPGDKPRQKNKRVTFDMDASHCAQFTPCPHITTDTSQVLDQYTRTLGGYKDVPSDRLVYEKHSREQQDTTAFAPPEPAPPPIPKKELKKICVNCDNYCGSYMGASEVEGVCRVLPGDKPRQKNKRVTFDTDASQCPQFMPCEHITTDTSQVLDQYTRTLGGYEAVPSDRLIYEKHARGQ